ncbi:MAG: DUF4386 domain-containing protein [Anaerolineae bacterium]|nr:DUF4386 domain-containing protein [Anaerolineae bacterium]
MNTDRKNAVIVGIFFIFATVTAILGFLLYQPIFVGPDYLVNGAAHKDQVILGVLMELILAIADIGTAIGLYPILKRYGERIALIHLFLRFYEAVIIMIGIISVLSLLTLSRDFVAASAPDADAYHVSGTLLHAVYSWTSILGPIFLLGLNTLMYSYLLFKSKLVPRPLATLGLTGAALVLGYGLLVIFGVVAQGSGFTLLAMPIAVYEMILAVWLIANGFNSSTIALESPKTVTNPLPSMA